MKHGKSEDKKVIAYSFHFRHNFSPFLFILHLMIYSDRHSLVDSTGKDLETINNILASQIS